VENVMAKKPVVAARRGPSPLVVVGIVVVVLFAAFVGFGVYRASRPDTANIAIPANATATGVNVGQPSAKATIDVYLDFQCPVCKAYEAQSGATIQQMVDDGQAKVVYHPLAFLDRMSSTQYSTRAAQASGCASDASVFQPFLKLLYDNQPPENGEGLPDTQLVAYLKQAGATGDVATCVNDNKYAAWTKGVTDAASKAGVNATPTIKVNGQQVDNTDAALRQAVAAAQK
jgi:protein-disulfide isomerase